MQWNRWSQSVGGLMLAVVVGLAATHGYAESTVTSQPTSLTTADVATNRMKQPVGYQTMMQLLKDYRGFEPDQDDDGVYDYSPAAMKRHHAGVTELIRRWHAIDTSGWSIEHRNDAFTVLGQINSLEYMHRGLRPWSRDPGFYSTHPIWQPNMLTAVDVPREFPLTEEQLALFNQRIARLPAALQQARTNLTEPSRDLADIAIKSMYRQSWQWKKARKQCEEHHPQTATNIQTVMDAIGEYQTWLKENRDTFTAPAGVGKEHYNWLLKNVHFLPYDWDQAWALARRELARAKTSLRLQEIANADLPPMRELPKTNVEEHRLFMADQQQMFDHAKKRNLFPAENYIQPKNDPEPEVEEEIKKPRNFFEEIEGRGNMPLAAHDLFGHKPDEGYRTNSISEYRCGTFEWLEIFRSEGMATSIEDVLVMTGLADDNPRIKELNYMLIAFRAARALSELKMISNELSFQEGMEFTIKNTPRGYAKDGNLTWGETQNYLRLTGYGLGYVIGKLQMEQLIADYSDIEGDEFKLSEFYRDFLHRGRLPITLLRWEMTGLDDEMKIIGLMK